MRTAGAVWVLTLFVTATQSRAPYPGMLDSHPAIDYRATPVNDPVTVMRREIEAGTRALAFSDRQGYLRSVLAALDIPIDSQILVFSKTGIQNAHTSPEHPRAFYFNDRAIVGYIPGAPLIEMASHDPRQGVIFQTLAQTAAAAQFARPSACLSCHVSENSLDVPGILVRSNFTAPDGRAMPQLGNFVIDHRAPFDRRWGGWYVTGSIANTRHLGNAFVVDPSNPEASVTEASLNRLTLDRRVDVGEYPAPTSDIVALMVFEHQGRAMNLLTRLGWETRIAAAEGVADFSRGDLGAALQATVDYLLFTDEAKLASPVDGVSSFAKTFAQTGPRDHSGRSLRELDLRARLFKYRCSYMIYSPAFDGLPDEAKRAVFARMRERITDPATRAILDETKAGWR